ncbi:MAG: hypothetical protein HYY06_24300 [Deltaproteobacteria bacterium]|nr:hypothetical protein [Deltaproteobacteria bacterium]
MSAQDAAPVALGSGAVLQQRVREILAGRHSPYDVDRYRSAGVFMSRGLAELGVDSLEEALPAYVTMVLIPLTSSIAQGILWGFVLHAACFTLAGRRRELSPMMWLLALVAAGAIALENPAAG